MLNQTSSMSLRAAKTLAVAALIFLTASCGPLSAQGIHSGAGALIGVGGSPERARKNALPRYLHFVKSKTTQSIAVLVNDDPITNYEIERRQGLLGSNGKGVGKRAAAKFKRLLKLPSTSAHLKKLIQQIVKANPGKSKDEIIAIFNRKKKAYAKQLQRRAVSSARASVLPGLRKKAVEELIDERLQLQEAKRLNVMVSDEDVEGVITDMAKRNKMTVKQFGVHLRKIGSDINTMRGRFKAMLSWRNVIRSLYGQQISVKSGDIDRVVAQASLDNAAKTEFKLQRITLAVPVASKPNVVAQRLKEANAIRQSFSGCATTGTLVKNFGGARLENLGSKNAATIKEPIRSMILNAADGEMLPPQMGRGAVYLWIICGRKAVTGNAARRTKAERSLQVKEYEVHGKRHLKNLRQDAHIEYR